MMIHLFKNGDTKQVDANIDKFLEVKDELVNGGYIEILDDNEDHINNKYKDKLEEFEKLSKKYEEDLKKYSEKLATCQEIKGEEKVVYNHLFGKDDVIILSEHKTFYQAFKEVNNDLEIRFRKKINDEKTKTVKMAAKALNLLSLILSIISFFIIEDLDPSLSILYYISFACYFINMFFIIFMGRKTDYGEIISARVKGFKNFLETAEKEKLEMLVEENPHYFYDILPYTYVLGISKKWIKKFENIKMPETNMGNYNYTSGNSLFNNFESNIYYPAPTHSSGSSGGGCSSCGGGCSSCGGGCSSCGGGGSW